MRAGACWAGVDVGGSRKGFHAALVDAGGRLSLLRSRSVDELVGALVPRRPEWVAVDAPREPAPDGASSRACERAFLARRVCGLYLTPDRARIASSAFYGWVRHGFTLYAALDAAGLRAFECFPTAAWTRWGGARGGKARQTWSTGALARIPVSGLPPRVGQDWRDAVAAALTARLHALGRTESFGALVIPAEGSLADLHFETARAAAPRDRW